MTKNIYSEEEQADNRIMSLVVITVLSQSLAFGLTTRKV